MSEDITIGGQFYTKFIDTNVTATNANPVIIFADPTVTVQVGGVVGEPGPHVEITPLKHICMSPDCLKVADAWNEIDNWIRVAHYLESNRYFCSLRCLANWLAGELAKEESR